MAYKAYEIHDLDFVQIERDARALQAKFVADGVKALYRAIAARLSRTPASRTA